MNGSAEWARFLQVSSTALADAPRDYLARIRAHLDADGIPSATARRDTPFLVNWLIAVSQYQGISDQNAAAFTAKNGLVCWTDISKSVARSPSCPRLRSFWDFDGCGYRKSAGKCAEPNYIAECPLPRHPARKGSLIQAAYALFLFVRDVCDGDLIGWIDDRLGEADPGHDSPDRAERMGAALLGPLRNVYGIGDKVWSMALADLLLAADPNRERWVTTGAGMVVVDSLLHNHLHRTGTLRRFGADHPYGPRCYAPGGCSDLIRGLAHRVDAREFDADFPARFPRFVQFAIYRISSSLGLDICNGNRIDDRYRCQNSTCPAYDDCDRVALHG